MWEYQVLLFTSMKTWKTRISECNQLGAEGWEMVSMTYDPGNYETIATFKRRVKSAPPQREREADAVGEGYRAARGVVDLNGERAEDVIR